MPRTVYINGEFVPPEEASVNVYDHGVLYGDGVFEGLRAYDGKVFRLAAHVRRLYQSAKAIWLEIPMPEATMVDAIDATVAASMLGNAYIRVLVTRGIGSLGLGIPRASDRGS